MNRTFYAVKANRSIPMRAMYDRLTAAGYSLEIDLVGDWFLRLAKPDAVATDMSLTVFNAHRPLLRIKHVEELMRADGLRPSVPHEGIEFVLAHPEVCQASLPLIVAGQPVRSGEGYPLLCLAFGVDGGKDLTIVQRGSHWGPVNFLATKL